MKNWNAQRTSLTERLADGSRYASGKTVEAADLSNFLQAVIGPGDRVCLEGDNQKQAMFSRQRLPTSIRPRSMIFT
jgi:malonate decarboxylase alpha subunit